MMNEYPLIGISGSINHEEDRHHLPRAYMRALNASGAVAVMLSYDMDDEALESCLDRMGGILLAGGNDVDPMTYGQPPVQALGEVNPPRDDFEMRLIRAAVKRGMPVLGICRGVQILNVALGGTLWQDLPSQFRAEDGSAPLLHSQTARGCYRTHEVRIVENTQLCRIEKDARICVNSFHHEAVREVAPCMRAAAYAPDGVIEAIEHPDLPFVLGVQWHPELYFELDSHSSVLFDSFVKAAAEYTSH